MYLKFIYLFILSGLLYNADSTSFASIGKRYELSSIDSGLVKKLLVVYEKDQYYRKNSDSFFIANRWKQDSLDRENQLVIDSIIDSFGYPGKSLVGTFLMNKAFLVIQHSDLSYQERYLPVLINAANFGELNWGSVALLIDRIEVSYGRKQIYGSQISIDSLGNKYVYPIKDEQAVNARRNSVGLDSLEKYLLRFNIIYKSGNQYRN